MLLGEGVFHQVHSGAFTSKIGKSRASIYSTYLAEYERLRGRKNIPMILFDCLYFGSVPQQARRFVGLERTEKAARTTSQSSDE